MFKIIPSITSVIALTAFIVAVVSVIIRLVLKNRTDLISRLPEKDRADVMVKLFSFETGNTEGLTSKQKSDLYQSQIKAKTKRLNALMRTSLIAFVVLLGVTVLIKPNPSNIFDSVKIIGTVTNENKTEVEGALVVIESFDISDVTDRGGRFILEIENIRKNDVLNIEASHPEYRNKLTHHTITSSTVELIIVLRDQ